PMRRRFISCGLGVGVRQGLPARPRELERAIRVRCPRLRGAGTDPTVAEQRPCQGRVVGDLGRLLGSEPVSAGTSDARWEPRGPRAVVGARTLDEARPTTAARPGPIPRRRRISYLR